MATTRTDVLLCPRTNMKSLLMRSTENYLPGQTNELSRLQHVRRPNATGFVSGPSPPPITSPTQQRQYTLLPYSLLQTTANLSHTPYSVQLLLLLLHYMPRISHINYLFVIHSCNTTLIQVFFLWRNSPTLARAASFLRFLDHIQWHTTVRRTPLDEWSARRRDLYLTNTQHSQQTDINAHGGIRNHDLSKRSAADSPPPRLRPLDLTYDYRTENK
jgi:hypothetical protein